jgi:glycosyltransferase involved in cell wall biosynthesis
MRVLVCALEAPLPPPNGLNLLVEGTLGPLRRDHDVRLLALRAAAQDPRAELPASRLVPAPRLGGAGAVGAYLAGYLRRRPWQVGAFERGIRVALAEEIARFDPDVVHVISGRLAGVWPEIGDKASILTAIDAWHLNADAAVAASRGVRRAALRAEAGAVRRFEAAAFGQFDRVAVITEGDRDALREVAPDLPVVVVPHGVDGTRYEWTAPVQRSPGRIMLHGVLSYPPNIDAARVLVHEVLPVVRREVPEAHVILVGRSPTPAVLALAEEPGVEVTGEVDDVRPWLASASVYACPMRHGGGVKNKVLEAMALGVPCVATSVATRGLDVEAGRDLIVEDDPATFAAAVVGVLRDPSLGAHLGAAGASVVRRAHSWDAVGEAYGRLYTEVVAARRGAGGA